jgi:hypothetical protein
VSSNVTAAWPYSIVCASDRRLTGLRSGEILTNRSTKLSVFGCEDAHGVVTYNGIGSDDSGLTPSDWLLELFDREKAMERPLAQVLELIHSDLEIRLRPIRAKYGPRRARHTFVVANVAPHTAALRTS